jgi:hypothetical protein
MTHPLLAVLDATTAFERYGFFESRVTPDGVLLARTALMTED